MTDFFSKLEDHLDDAARREADSAPRHRRVAFARPLRAVAFAAALLAVVAIGVTALSRVATDDTEVAATQKPDEGWTSYVPLDCGKEHSEAIPSEGGPFPERVRARFSVFSPDSRAEQVRPAIEGFAGLPVSGLQTKEGRLVAERGDVEVYLVAAAHVSELRCTEVPAGEEGAARAALPEKLTPGVCLLLQGPKSHAAACWTLAAIDGGASVLGPKPFGDLVAAAIPDGHPQVLVGTETAGAAGPVTNNVFFGPSAGPIDGALRWQDSEALTPVDKTGSPPDYGCDGPVHPETLAAYGVLRNDPDPDGFEKIDPPEGITFLKEPVLAREVFGQKIWLIPAADQADCSKPVICIATDFAATDASCSPVEANKSTPLQTRVDPSPSGAGLSFMAFAAAPSGIKDQRVSREGFDDLELSAQGGILVTGGKLPEERARQTAEAFGGAQFEAGDGTTADHDDR